MIMLVYVIILYNNYLLNKIGVEMVGPKRREVTGIVLNYFYALGEAAVGLIAWLTKDWVVTQLLVSAPPFIFIIYYW